MSNPDRLSRTVERVVEDFCWIQWDGHTQRIYYLTCAAPHAQASAWHGGLDSRSDHKRLTQDRFLLRCVQFHLHQHWETVVSQFSVSEFDFFSFLPSPDKNSFL